MNATGKDTDKDFVFESPEQQAAAQAPAAPKANEIGRASCRERV